MNRSITRFATIVAAFLLLAADAPPQTIDAGGLTFDVPAAWKSKPGTGMRRIEIDVPAEKKEETGGKLVVFAFGGGGGGVEANVERWRKTFKGPDGETPKADVKQAKGKNVDVTRVEIAGDYHPTAFPGRTPDPDIPNGRLLAAIVLTDDTGYFLRFVGPDKLVKAASGDFDKLVSSLQTK